MSDIRERSFVLPQDQVKDAFNVQLACSEISTPSVLPIAQLDNSLPSLHQKVKVLISPSTSEFSLKVSSLLSLNSIRSVMPKLNLP